MTMTDPISDYLTRIRNGIKAKMTHVDVPASRVKAEMSRILLETGYLVKVKYMEDDKQGILRVFLKYDRNMRNAITGLKRVSKPSLRIYSPKTKLPRVMGGYGISIVSTSQGLLQDSECKKRGIGGEVLCIIW
ncbi:MAG: 30S ribosomal protein S8 [Deltaproteobacteria bacterium]|nr:30S ribosomal protein S8 [Deltaproteobacteria bacterium]